MAKTTLILSTIAINWIATVSGCALSDPTDPYDGLPEFWRGRTDQVNTSSDEEMHSALVHPDGPLTLEAAVNIALTNNPELAAQKNEAEAAAAQEEFASGEVLPHFSIEAGYSYFLDNQRIVPASANMQAGVFGRNLFSGDIVMRIPIYTGGRIASQIKAAELLNLAAHHKLGRSRDEVIFNVSSLYFNILAQKHVIESLDFSRQALERHLERVEHLISAEKAARVDKLRTEVRLADIAQQLVAQRNVLAVQREALSNLLGLSQNNESLEVVGDLEEEYPALPAQQQAIDMALEQREDFLAAQASLEAQARAVDAARAEQWPVIYGQASYGGRWVPDPGQHPFDTDNLDDIGRVGVMGEIPLYQGGQVKARIQREKAKLSAARQRLRTLGLRIQLEVKTSLLNTQSAYEQVQATETAIEQAKESLRIERAKYEQGKGSITDVLDAQSSLLSTQTSYYKALAAYNVALAQYRLSIGESQR